MKKDGDDDGLIKTDQPGSEKPLNTFNKQAHSFKLSPGREEKTAGPTQEHLDRQKISVYLCPHGIHPKIQE